MNKYRVEVGSFVTSLKTRHITVTAENPEQAQNRAIEKFESLENANPKCVDSGTPQVDFIKEIN